MIVMGLLGLGVAALVAGGLMHGQRSRDAWIRAANSLGLDYDNGGLLQSRKLQGRVKGLPVRVDAVTETSGDDTYQFTRYRLRHERSLGLRLVMEREGFLSGLGKILGIEDITTGDRHFDSMVLLRGASASSINAFLTPELRQRIVEFMHAFPKARIDDEGIVVQENGVEGTSSRLIFVVGEMVSLSDALTGNALPDNRREARSSDVGSGARPARAGQGRSRDRVEEASYARQKPQASSEPKSRSDSKAKSRSDSKPKSRSDSKSKSPAGSTPGSPAGSQPKSRSDSKPKSSDPQSRATTEPVADATATQGETSVPAQNRALEDLASEICEKLFGPGITSMDAEARFEEEYKGREIRWKGELEWVDATGADLHLGADSGARGVIRVCSPTSGLVGGSAVRAHVILKGTTTEDLRKLVGTTVAFTGRLSHCDAFARSLYVADGRLTH